MYNVGLVLGKFMPIHKGHQALIEYAKSKCDKLIILVCAKDNEPIDGVDRYYWVRKLCMNNKVRVVYCDDDLPDAPYSDKIVSKVWAEYLKKRFPMVNVIIGSEKYIQYVAEYMNIEPVIYDINRNTVPISATMIRENPYKYWNYIPNIVKPYFTKKICIYGSESCGKSILTVRLAEHYQTSYVPEMARYVGAFSNINWDNCKEEDFIAFARCQHDMIKTMTPLANKVLFVDSDNLTTQIYAKTYIGMGEKEISKYNTVKYDAYILMMPDCPFIQDGTRKYENQRWEMHNLFKQKLIDNGIEFYEIGGTWFERFEDAKKIVDNLIKY
jgi:HTH-type transcriptional repressor of NAD biosynthesis genes